MYEYKGLQDIFFVMLYGGATLLAVMACLYLLLTRGNMFSSAINPPKTLRRWTAAFMASVAASHVWWVMLGMYWLTDDRLSRNIVAITLDRLTFVPLMMVVLLRMLQDRRRPLWPVFVAMIPFAVTAVVSLVKRNNDFEWFIEIYSILLALVFTVYFVFAVRQYGRWLHENFADLEHKEVWQSLLLLAFILLVFMAYASNGGALGTEYLAQINTLIIITFILWRVETLQQLDAMESSEASEESEESAVASNANNIGALLELHCEATRLYLQHDLTLQQLAIAIGTNRTYLSNYFAQQGITYNAYINRLRIEHFMRLHLTNRNLLQPATAAILAQQSGFHSYTTFSIAFKKHTGTTVTAWMKAESMNEK